MYALSNSVTQFTTYIHLKYHLLLILRENYESIILMLNENILISISLTEENLGTSKSDRAMCVPSISIHEILANNIIKTTMQFTSKFITL